ncbi:hypothetical protein LCGC14_0393680 [marine sediment metagenome]|uniref:Pentapeptide MXKDX repeat protein n=3 Tax=root TaxID=1 RepID=A0A7V1FQG2_9GAMM|nr:hypothetical protein [Marinobacter antarcticus]HDZ55320.1 hypothetical protein [Halopseudomonas xinjiangensis]HEA51708.1 hypothetical protein [Marinobacter antarcticus]
MNALNRKTLTASALTLGLLGIFQISVATAGEGHDMPEQSSSAPSHATGNPGQQSQQGSGGQEMDHGSMDHGSMKHEGMDHSKMDSQHKDNEADGNADHHQ